jgi:hypothetical protein
MLLLMDFVRADPSSPMPNHILKQEVVVSFDLADFFPTVGFNRVMATFRRIGYPRTVARYLAALCTKTTPYEVWQQHPEKRSSLP